MKKVSRLLSLLLCFLLLIGVFSGTAMAASATTKPCYAVAKTTKECALLNAPGNVMSLVCKIPKGASVTLLSQTTVSKDVWYEATYDSSDTCYKGYIDGSCLNIDDDAKAAYVKNKCTYYPCYAKITIKKATNVNKQPCSESTNCFSELYTTLDGKYIGQELIAVALYCNDKDSYWYKLAGSGFYVYAGNVSTQLVFEDQVTVTGVKAPSGTHKKGSSFLLYGKIQTDYLRLTKVGAQVFYADNLSKVATGKTVSVDNVKKYEIRNSTLDNSCKFGSLAEGSYFYIISATAKNCYSPDGKTLKTETFNYSGLKNGLYYSSFVVGNSSYTIEFNGNGGSGSPTSQTVAKGKSVKLPTASDFKKDCCTLLGWAASKSATEPDYQPGASYTVNSNVTLYAVWSQPEHTWGEWEVTTEPTCTSKGVETRVCIVNSDHIETREVEMLNHTPAEPVRENEVAAACEKTGSYDEVVYCSACHIELSREAKTIPALGHDWDDGKVTTEPTCEGEGVMTFTCKNDSTHTRTEPIKPLGHTPADPVHENVNEAACEKPGSYDEVVYCSVCHNELTREAKTIPALGHDWDDGKVTTEPTCEGEGVMTFTCKNDSTHTYTEPIKPLGHIPADPERENMIAPTCVSAGSYDEVVYCSVCHKELSRETETYEALGHDWSEWKVTKAATEKEEGIEARFCHRCGEMETRPIPCLAFEIKDVVIEDGKVTVAMSRPCETSTAIFIAGYDESGRLCSIRMVMLASGEDTADTEIDGAWQYKVFALDAASFAPLCAPVAATAN